jgi:hypothetical protein
MTWNRVFPERMWKLERPEGPPKRPRATIPRNRLEPFSRNQRIGRRRALHPMTTIVREFSVRLIDQESVSGPTEIGPPGAVVCDQRPTRR